MIDVFSPDCLFPTDNNLEIPELMSDMQAEFCEIPFVCFGETARTYQMKGTGTLHFYTDDYRFNSLYDHPDKILRMDPSNIVEPNYSVFTDTPIAFGLQAIYRKRWIARMMQEHGIRVFVNLNVAPKYYQVNLYGVPKGWRSFCTRGSEDRMSQLDNEFNLAKMRRGGDDILFVCYGVARNVGNGAKFIMPYMSILSSTTRIVLSRRKNSIGKVFSSFKMIYP